MITGKMIRERGELGNKPRQGRPVASRFLLVPRSILFFSYHFTRNHFTFSLSSCLAIVTFLVSITASGAEPAPAQGLAGAYYAGRNFDTLRGTRTDPAIDFASTEKLAAEFGGAEGLSVRWTGQVKADADEVYTFQVASRADVRLWVDGTLLIDNWRRRSREKDSAEAALKGGRWYDLQLDFSQGKGSTLLQLFHGSASTPKRIIPPTHLRPTADRGETYAEPYVAPPDFLDAAHSDMERALREAKDKVDETMKLSFEPTFFTLTDLCGYSKPEPRSTALVRAAIEKEQQGEYREAIEIYQKTLDEHPDDLYRVSKYGIYVPVSQYCQRRLLRFPRKDLLFYRAKHDARAREAFEQARRKHSLEGLAEVADSMLATSYGGKALLSLGDAAFDRGHYLEALGHYSTVQSIFPDKELHTPELELKIACCRKMLGEPSGARSEIRNPKSEIANLLESMRPEVVPFHTQAASAPNVACDDYTLFPPTDDPLALKEPVWKHGLAGSRRDFYVFTQPVVTANSVLYRHKNIIYCRSILTGEPRWVNDIGGRVTWQNRTERQYPQEDLLAQDGLVFTPIHKVGPTLAALDETTGELKWAYGPMVAATREEAQMRFEAAPAGGPRTVYAGYVLDDIEGDTHVDTEYGVIAFESTTGRVRWCRPIARLRPGEFSAQVAERRRNRIRSFTSPPLYHQGTVYYNTNAGAVAALDALSGQVRWVMRYPYYALPYSVHDATREFGSDRFQYNPPWPHRPMFWYNQRPLLVGERLYVLPVDARHMLCLDRRTGKVQWSKPKGTRSDFSPENPVYDGEHWEEGGATYVLGPIRTGELAIVYRSRQAAVHLVDPATGRTVWVSPDLLLRDDQPVMKYQTGLYTWAGIVTNQRLFCTSARPFLSSDGRLIVTSHALINTGSYGLTFGYGYNICALDLEARKVLDKRRYYTGEVFAIADLYIHKVVPEGLKGLKELPHKDERIKKQIAELEEIAADTVPTNQHGPFLPFSRLTFQRYGVPFELRTGPRSMEMVYDRAAVEAAVASRNDPDGVFARAELALGSSRLADAAGLMKKCLDSVSSEDVDFRAAVNQQLYKVHKGLAQSGVRAGVPARELEHAIGMRRTVSTQAEEIETLFALAEAYERKGDLKTAAAQLRSIANTYGHCEYPVPSLLAGDLAQLLAAANGTFDRGEAFVGKTLYAPQFQRSLGLMRKGLPLYFSTLSPLEKDLTVRAGELAAQRLVRLLKLSPEAAAEHEAAAGKALEGRPRDEQLYRLWEFPATRAAQKVLDSLFDLKSEIRNPKSEIAAAARRRLWRLADAARVCGLTVPEAHRQGVSAPPLAPRPSPLALPLAEREIDLADEQGTAWLVLQRHGQSEVRPELLFLGGRVQKKFDSKFVLACVDMSSGKLLWKGRERRGEGWSDELRLKGKGNEPGFFEAFVHGNLVVVHGLYDVLAFHLASGELAWRYEVPFDFEIRHAVMSGNLLVLAGQAETLALYVPTDDPRGEVAWQEKEAGDLYAAPWFHGERLVSLRKLPFNVTARFRATGKLIGRLALPDLSLQDAHPLLEDGPKTLPAAHDGRLLVVTDGWYYIAVDTDRMKIAWKRLIDQSDPTREPAMRLALKGEYLAVTKEDFDRKAIYLLSSSTGEVLWRTEPKEARSPQPLYSVVIEGDALYGLGVHPGQGFYFTGLSCQTGQPLWPRREEKDYQGKPSVALLPRLYGPHAVALVKDRQDFELKVFDVRDGKLLHRVRTTGVGDFGTHGRVSATLQNGGLAILSKDKLKLGARQ